MPAIVLLLTEGYADWECALLSAMARTHLACTLTIATPDGKPVTSMGGLQVLPGASLGSADPATFDALVLSGGTAWSSDAAPDVTGDIMRFADAGKVVGGICDATKAMAEAGLLDRHAHTSNSAATLDVPGYSGGHRYRDQPAAVRDGNIVTAPGNAPLTFAREMLAALGLAGPELDEFLVTFTRESAGLGAI